MIFAGVRSLCRGHEYGESCRFGPLARLMAKFYSIRTDQDRKITFFLSFSLMKLRKVKELLKCRCLTDYSNTFFFTSRCAIFFLFFDFA